jgi:hypothetical protein
MREGNMDGEVDNVKDLHDHVIILFLLASPMKASLTISPLQNSQKMDLLLPLIRTASMKWHSSRSSGLTSPCYVDEASIG